VRARVRARERTRARTRAHAHWAKLVRWAKTGIGELRLGEDC